MATSKPRPPANLAAHEERFAAHEAAGRSKGARTRADYDMLVATGRREAIQGGPHAESGFFDNLLHDPYAMTEVNQAASAAAREDRFYRPTSRQGLHPDVEAKEREGGYDWRAEAKTLRPANKGEGRRRDRGGPPSDDDFQSRAEWREKPLY